MSRYLLMIHEAASVFPRVPVPRPPQSESERNSICLYHLLSQTTLCACELLMAPMDTVDCACAISGNNADNVRYNIIFLLIFLRIGMIIDYLCKMLVKFHIVQENFQN